MPVYEVITGTVEQDGKQYGPEHSQQTLELSEATADFLGAQVEYRGESESESDVAADRAAVTDPAVATEPTPDTAAAGDSETGTAGDAGISAAEAAPTMSDTSGETGSGDGNESGSSTEGSNGNGAGTETPAESESPTDWLTSFDGIGPERAKSLAAAGYTDPAAIRDASVEDLAAIEGVSEGVAQGIKNSVASDEQ